VTDNPSASVGPLVGHDRVRKVVQGLLRAAQSEWTDETLEGVTGICRRTIKSYRVEGKEPSLANALSLAVVLGQPALNSILALIGYVARPLDEADAMNPALIVASILPHVSTIARAGADGRIDHTEAPDCEDAADQIIASVLPLSSVGKAE
jgi:hypothetical protein